jgi:translation initiation factor 2 beta subunit (eIF-2beta)/eIF-5
MKVKYISRNNRLSVEIETESAKETFKKLARFQEVFDESECALCKNDELQFVVRTVDGNDFFELKCKKCYAKLGYGQHKVGNTLFAKRKKEDGSFDKETLGWHRWKASS